MLAGFATAIPKTMDGAVEMIRQLKVAHDTAVKQRAATMVTLKAMLVHAPEQLRADTARKTQRTLARTCAAFRPRSLVSQKTLSGTRCGPSRSVALLTRKLKSSAT